MTIKQHFKEFLQKEGALLSFEASLPIGGNLDDLFYDMPAILISGNFSWWDSRDIDWSKLDQKWRNHLKTIEQ